MQAMVLDLDAARRRGAGDRAGATRGAVQPLRVEVERDRDAVTSSLVDDLARLLAEGAAVSKQRRMNLDELTFDPVCWPRLIRDDARVQQLADVSARRAIAPTYQGATRIESRPRRLAYGRGLSHRR